MKKGSKKRETKGIFRRLEIAAGFAATGAVLRIGARKSTAFADAYRKWTNAFWVNTLGRLSSVFPFSVAEILIYAAVIVIPVFLISCIVLAVRKKSGTGLRFCRGLSHLALIAGIIFFLYESGEDLPFFGTTFSDTYGYEDNTYSTAELTDVCRVLAQNVNCDAEKVSRDADGIMKNDAELAERVRKNMRETGEKYPSLSGWYPRPKPVFLSKLMSRTNLTGIYTAWTEEANYNRDIPDYNIAFTISHELSHLKGVLPENEANFAAYLSCIDSPDTDIRYSGEMMGYIYCINELYKRDRSKWQSVAGTLSDKANGDLNDNTAYWKKFRGKTAKASRKINDAYLKQAGQSAGVESYNQVTALIVNYIEKNVKDA